MLASKFRGSFLGALVGDCFGAPFEGEVCVSKVVLQQYLDGMMSTDIRPPYKPYTDDTAMTKSLAQSLIENRGFDPLDVARTFTLEYFRDPKRGYGSKVTDVFNKLRLDGFKDPYGPAKAQFNGMGSLGNGGAMRVAPVPLFYYENLHDVVEKARLSALITHTHEIGVNGTILQACAIYQGLHADPTKKLNVQAFCEGLISKLSGVETDDGLGVNDPRPYRTQLHLILKLLAVEGGSPDKQVQTQLGTSISAQFSVPTAIYCFLRAQEEIPDIKTDNPFQRTIQYAISLGGDTDTIASMAGAIAGAYYGDSIISGPLLKHCEAVSEMSILAGLLFEFSRPV